MGIPDKERKGEKWRGERSGEEEEDEGGFQNGDRPRQ